MIRNIEQTKFLTPSDYAGLNGIWVMGEGVLFDSEDDANTHYRNNKTGNEMNPVMRKVTVGERTYYQKVATNSFD